MAIACLILIIIIAILACIIVGVCKLGNDDEYNDDEFDEIIDVICKPECQCYRCDNTCYRCEGCINNNCTIDCDKFVPKRKRQY